MLKSCFHKGPLFSHELEAACKRSRGSSLAGTADRHISTSLADSEWQGFFAYCATRGCKGCTLVLKNVALHMCTGPFSAACKQPTPCAGAAGGQAHAAGHALEACQGHRAHPGSGGGCTGAALACPGWHLDLRELQQGLGVLPAGQADCSKLAGEAVASDEICIKAGQHMLKACMLSSWNALTDT